VAGIDNDDWEARESMLLVDTTTGKEDLPKYDIPMAAFMS
jgi:hypothetical protein